MSEDRSVHTDALHTLGTIIDDKQGRDAIHLAVEPVIAGERLKPGQDVGLKDGVAIWDTDWLGIVDPFLKNPVQKGERFWLVVYPRQITSLRHVWEHPGFPAQVISEAPSKSESEKWMRAWAMEHTSYDYYGSDDGGKLSEDGAYSFAINAGHNLSVGPYEDARDHIDNEWWAHWEAITGCRGQRGEYFSCSC